MKIDVKKAAVKNLVEILQKNIKTSDELLDEVADIYLQFAVKKIPNIANKIIKIKLPHGIHKKNTEVCLFVKDLDKKSREHELTSDHFKDLLKSKGVTCVSEIIPMKALKLEYKPHEAKRNLSQNYDVYLGDERIIRLLPPLLGKHFYGKKRHPVQVNLQATDLKKEITNAVNNTRCIMKGRGAVSLIRVGHFDLKTKQIVENIMSTIEQLVTALPGGAVNLRNIYIKTQNSMALPLYVSMGSTDKVILLKPERKKNNFIIEEITTVENGRVKVTPTGYVRVIKGGGTGIRKPKGKKDMKRLQSKAKKVKPAAKAKQIKQGSKAKKIKSVVKS